ncbi:MAG: hypothetical protein II393_04775 [Cytophagales bacterium]|nr:hypothetical protein [Cytophagales bacterium]
MSLIKKICSILFVAYDICCCCDCNKRLYAGYKKEISLRKTHNVFFAQKITPIFGHDKNIQSENNNFDKIKNENFKQTIENIISQCYNSNTDYPEGFAFDAILDSSYIKDKPSDEKVRKYFFVIGNEIPCLFISTNNKSQDKKPLLVFYHGNGDNIYDFLIAKYGNPSPLGAEEADWWGQVASRYDILIPELPGYNFNQYGDFSEETRNKQINYIYQWCQKYYAGNLVVMGYSLGCHFAILLAAQAQNNCRYLVLSNPFLTDKTAAKRSVNSCLICCVKPIYKEKLNNGEQIKKVTCPIDLYYSFKDKVVDPQDAKRLYDIAKGNNPDQSVSLFPLYSSRISTSLDPWYDQFSKSMGVCLDIEWVKKTKLPDKDYHFYENHSNVFSSAPSLPQCRLCVTILDIIKKHHPSELSYE